MPHLSQLSRLFQQRCIDFSQLHTHISNTICVLETLKTQDGPNLKKLETVFTEELSTFRITVKERDPENFRKNVREAYIDAIVANIKSRFPDMTIITSFGIFDPSKTPAKSSESFTQYREDQLEVLIQHFGESYLDKNEWIYTKQLLTDSFSILSTREVLEMILKDTSLTTLVP